MYKKYAHTIKTKGELEEQLNLFLLSALDVGEWSGVFNLYKSPLYP
jgi:hypothetical protein